MKIDNKLYSILIINVKQLMKEYKYIFTWSYHNVKGIPPHYSTTHWVQHFHSICSLGQIPNEPQPYNHGETRFGQAFSCQIHQTCWLNHLAIPICHCIKEEWEATYIQRFSQTQFNNKKGSKYPFSFIEKVLDAVTWDLFLLYWIFKLPSNHDIP
jgi:hypothetical protein